MNPSPNLKLAGADMIIPTPEFDPLFAEDGIPFQQKMREYIEREFADVPNLSLILQENLDKSSSSECIVRLPAPAQLPHSKAA